MISDGAVRNYVRYCEQLRERGGRILEGGARLQGGDLGQGHFVAPTLAEAPPDHPLFEEEMFLPILMVARVRGVEEGMALANAARLGLTAACHRDAADPGISWTTSRPP